MQPILSATGTYNFLLAKWLDERLKPLSINKFTIMDPLKFVEKVRGEKVDADEILVSYDVTSFFTNVPVDEAIKILVKKAFKNNWLNKTYKLNLKRSDLETLLNLAVKHQLFNDLYEQVDGVAMGSPLGPLRANTFMCSLEERLVKQKQMPSFCRRFVDDTITKQSSAKSANEFLSTLNNCHPSLQFTMGIEVDGKLLPFLGAELIRKDDRLESKVYIKPTNTGLLLHFDSNVDMNYKKALFVTMLNCAFQLSSTWKYFTEECERLREVFLRLRYPPCLLDSIFSSSINKKHQTTTESAPVNQEEKESVLLLQVPFKSQKSADVLRRQLNSLCNLVGTRIQPVFSSKKIAKEFRIEETKPPLVNRQCVVYKFQCDLCDADYVGYTCRHLHQRIEEHKGSMIGQHMIEHGENTARVDGCFEVLKKCRSKFECLLFKMLFIKDIQPSMNKQLDSIRAKLFT